MLLRSGVINFQISMTKFYPVQWCVTPVTRLEETLYRRSQCEQ